MTSSSSGRDDKDSLFGWCMYDWANSAYATTVSAGLFPAYFIAAVVPISGWAVFGFEIPAASLHPFAVGFAAFLAFLAAPILGAIADFSAAKKRFLLFFAYLGATATLLLYFAGPGRVAATLTIFIIAQIGFVAANVFYDAFLPQIATGEEMDQMSARGFAYGYLGGGLQFALSLGLVAGYEQIGISRDLAVRLSMAMAALWWGGFTLVTMRKLKEPRIVVEMPERFRRYPKALAYAAVGISRTLETTRKVSRFPHLALFLVAFMFYNDGIQTVLQMAVVYGTDELGLDFTTLMLTLLIVQFVAIAGAVVFSRIARVLGTKRSVMITLVAWSGIVIYAYFIETAGEFFLLGALVGIVMGGSQALSRSFYGSMIPANASAEFYGFYSVFAKFSAITGPFVFGIVRMVGSSRTAILSLIVFFIVGLILLYFVDEEKARLAETEGAF